MHSENETLNGIQAAEPSDFREKLDARQLAGFAIEAVHRVQPGSSTFHRDGKFFSRSMLFTLLTYCYATGVYASTDIEEAIRDDETVRYLCACVFPDFEDIRQFRRRNAPELKECLIQLFSILSDHSDGHFDKYADWELITEAERRLRIAIQADSMAMDF